tara:strand:- start:110 stop:319 length:210 start_codon:yes stop_codon:yes gene_type:complete
MADYVDGHGDVHTKIETSDIENWESEYLTMANSELSDRQKDLLKGDPIKSHEGMLYGSMYSDWKKRKET